VTADFAAFHQMNGVIAAVYIDSDKKSVEYSIVFSQSASALCRPTCSRFYS